MHVPKDAVLLRIFLGEADKFHGRPLYEAIVMKARELQLAGATVLRGPMGFGPSSRVHTAKILRLSEDLPFVIEIVDSGREDRYLPADPRRHVGQRTRHTRKGKGAAIRQGRFPRRRGIAPPGLSFRPIWCSSIRKQLRPSPLFLSRSFAQYSSRLAISRSKPVSFGG